MDPRTAPALRAVVLGTGDGPDAVRRLLVGYPGLEVVADGPTANADAIVRNGIPDVTLIALDRRAAADVPALVELARHGGGSPVVLVYDDCPRDELLAVLEAGAHGCVSQSGGASELSRALEAVREGRRYIDPATADLILRGRRADAPRPAAPGRRGESLLTPREREVLTLIAAGLTEREIGGRLRLSPKTVHAHRTTIMRKMAVHNAVTLVRRAMQLGLVR